MGRAILTHTPPSWSCCVLEVFPIPASEEQGSAITECPALPANKMGCCQTIASSFQTGRLRPLYEGRAELGQPRIHWILDLSSNLQLAQLVQRCLYLGSITTLPSNSSSSLLQNYRALPSWWLLMLSNSFSPTVTYMPNCSCTNWKILHFVWYTSFCVSYTGHGMAL